LLKKISGQEDKGRHMKAVYPVKAPGKQRHAAILYRQEKMSKHHKED